MKKLVIGFLVLLTVGAGALSAESDIQITMPFLGMFYTMNASYEQYFSKESGIIGESGSLLSVKNQNLLGNGMFGFYESADLIVINGIGIQFGGGGAFRPFENEVVSFVITAGPHIQIISNGVGLEYGNDWMNLGAEAEVQAKITPRRLCSLVLGMKFNFNFYTSQELSVRYGYKSSYYPIKKYFCFYLQPYISFCVNFR